MNNTNSRDKNSQNYDRNSHFYHLADEIYRFGYNHGFSNGSEDIINDYDERDYGHYIDDYDDYYSSNYRREEPYKQNYHRDVQGLFISKEDNTSGRTNGYYANQREINKL